MGCVPGFLQVENGKDVGGEVREDGYGGRGVHVHSAKSRAAEGHVFGDLREATRRDWQLKGIIPET